MATTRQENNGAIQVLPPRNVVSVRDVSDSGPLANLLDTARFEHLQRIATMMGRSSLVPKHLKGQDAQETIGNCFRVVNQALRWGFDPFAVADESYVVSGKLGYQGKLVAAVINSRAGIIGRLKPTYTGDGLDRTVTIAATFKDEQAPCSITLSVRQAKTANDMWTKDPDQKLFYSGAIKWARRYCPEVIMGVLTEEDLERIAELPESRTYNVSTSATKAAEMLGDGEPKPTQEAPKTTDQSNAEPPQAEDPKADAATLMLVNDEFLRLKMKAKEITAACGAVGAKGVQTLRQGQAVALLERLKGEPTPPE